jgi:hypothetical protein
MQKIKIEEGLVFSSIHKKQAHFFFEYTTGSEQQLDVWLFLYMIQLVIT